MSSLYLCHLVMRIKIYIYIYIQRLIKLEVKEISLYMGDNIICILYCNTVYFYLKNTQTDVIICLFFHYIQLYTSIITDLGKS